jgi:hypothetical protein
VKRRPAPAPILDAATFQWHSSAEHDAGSDAFRARQAERVRRMQTKPEATATVAQIAKARKV